MSCYNSRRLLGAAVCFFIVLVLKKEKEKGEKRKKKKQERIPPVNVLPSQEITQNLSRPTLRQKLATSIIDIWNHSKATSLLSGTTGITMSRESYNKAKKKKKKRTKRIAYTCAWNFLFFFLPTASVRFIYITWRWDGITRARALFFLLSSPRRDPAAKFGALLCSVCCVCMFSIGRTQNAILYYTVTYSFSPPIRKQDGSIAPLPGIVYIIRPRPIVHDLNANQLQKEKQSCIAVV